MLVLDQLRRGNQRLRWLAITVFLGLGILLAGLWYVQVVAAQRYQVKIRNQTFRTVRVPGVRGKILDRNGAVLAENRPGYILNLYTEELRPLFLAEYNRQKAAFLAAKMATNPAPSLNWFERLKAAFHPTSRAGHLSRADVLTLNERVRYAVVSNTFAQVGALLGTPVAISEKDYERHHNQWPYRPLPILENLTPQQVARFLEQAPVLPGVDLEVQPVRYYPHGPGVAHVLGYLVRDDLARDGDEEGFDYSLPSYQGAIGIESGYNEALSGRPGIQSIVVNSLCYRESETTWAPAEAGQNVFLTLDLQLQLAAWRALQSSGANTRGAVVVLDVTDGDLLALASSPAYDPNAFIQGMSQDEYNRFMNDPQLRQTFNRATQGAYPPGSIFKIVTALACLENGLDPAATYQVEPNPSDPAHGAFFLGRRKIKDLARPGEYDFRRAFFRSSNSYFVFEGLQTGRDRLLEMGKRFFLGERIGLPLRQEVRGDFPYPREARWAWTQGKLADACIGQGITVTPLQMAVMTAAVANGGKVFWPRLVLRMEPPEPEPGVTATEFGTRVRGDLGVNPQNLQLIREAMLADTEDPEGTGFTAFHERDRKTPVLKHLRVGGKTGTAEIEEHGRVVDHIAWFASFAPYEAPRFVVIAMIEGGSSGGGTCAPIVRQVYQALERRFWADSIPAGRSVARSSDSANRRDLLTSR